MSWQKQKTVAKLLTLLNNRRSIVFCSNIEQTEALGIPCVNSKIGTENLNEFNNDKINSISCVNMLDEGMNLNNCQVGIFMMLNSSKRMQIQKCGRLLRHPNPVIIIPYFIETREDEIFTKMFDLANDKVVIAHSVEDAVSIINNLH